MTDSEVKSSPATEAGRELLRKARTTDGWHTNFDAGDIAAIEQQAREGGYSSGLLEGRREAVLSIRIEHSPTGEREDRRFRAGGEWSLANGPYSYLTDDLSVTVGMAGLNASESPPIYGMTHEDVRGCPILHGGTVCTCGLGRLAVDHLRDASESPPTHRNAAGIEFVTVACPVCKFTHAHRVGDASGPR